MSQSIKESVTVEGLKVFILSVVKHDKAQFKGVVIEKDGLPILESWTEDGVPSLVTRYALATSLEIPEHGKKYYRIRLAHLQGSDFYIGPLSHWYATPDDAILCSGYPHLIVDEWEEAVMTDLKLSNERVVPPVSSGIRPGAGA